MGHARYIGRVGALAVALGIGAAVANTPGVAWAEPDSTANSSPDSSWGRVAGVDVGDVDIRLDVVGGRVLHRI